MKKTLLFAVLALAACKKTKVQECEDFMAVADKIQKCEKIPQASRDSMGTAMKSMRDALKMLEDVDPPKSQLDMLARTCKNQLETVRNLYEKTAADCLK